MAITKKTTVNNAGEDVEKSEPRHTLSGMETGEATGEGTMEDPQNKSTDIENRLVVTK